MAFKNPAQDTAHPYRAIWRLSWPQVLMMFLQFWIGFVDVYVAGLINREVQASLGLITTCLFFLLIVATAVANGAVAAVSQSVGAGLYRRGQRYVGLCLTLALVMGALLMLAGLAGREAFLVLLQVPPELRAITGDFLAVYALLLPAYHILLIANAVFRARKEVIFPTLSILLVCVVNAVADFGLGLGLWGLPALGHSGLAWATFWSVTAGAALNLVMLRRKGLLRREAFAPWRWVRRALPRLLRVAGPSGLMQVLWQSGYLMLFAITGSLPHGNITALAGMTAGGRIEALLFLPGFAFNMTASVLVGHYLGAGQPAEAKRFGFRVLGIGVAIMSLVALGLWQVAQDVADIMSDDPAVRLEIMSYLSWNLLAIPFTLTGMIMGGALGGAGATVYTMIVFGTTIWCVRLPLAWILGHHVLGEARGVWISMLVSQMVQALVILYVFAFKDWKRFALVRRASRRDPAGLAEDPAPLPVGGNGGLRK
jgi:putative MATE family efflux protein